MAFGAGSSNCRKMEGVLNDDDSHDRNAPLMNSFLKSSEPGFKNNLRVLVVDDDKVIRKIMMAMLGALKVEGKEAVNGKEAVDLFVAGEVFNLVLMDMEMPVMTGLQATKYLREMGVGVKLVGVSSHSTNKTKQHFLDAGADEFFAKPMTRAKLSELLQAVDENL